MNRPFCPYLGLKEDPSTALSFTSEGNYCHRARPVSQVNSEHQEEFCLTSRHTACPLYLASSPRSMPAAFSAGTAAPVFNLRSRKTLAFLGIPALLAGALALTLLSGALGDRLRFPFASVPKTGANPSAPGGWTLFLTKTYTTREKITPSPLPNLVPTNCPLPQGWEPYTVNPTDSLYRLSVVYGVTVNQLQEANCMGDKTVILPGQIIYVPAIPTDTPTPIPTTTPIPPTWTSAPKNPAPASPSDTPVTPKPTQVKPSPTMPPPSKTPPPPAQPTHTPWPFPTLIPPTSIPIEPTIQPPKLPTLEPRPTIKPTKTEKPKEQPKPTKTKKPKKKN